MSKKDESKKFDEELLQQLRNDAEELVGIDHTIADRMFVEIAALSYYVTDLRKRVDEEGTMVLKVVGTVNNRREEMRENPALTTYSKAIGRLGDLMKKASSIAKHASVPEEEDDFDEFNS